MAAQFDWARWGWGICLGMAAVPLGVLAGLDPSLALTASAAAVFALIAFTDLAGAVAVFTFVGFFALDNFAQDGVVRVVLGLACFALIAVGRRRDVDLLSSHPWVATALGLFLGWAALSMVWAESPGEALYAVERWLLSAVLLVVVAIAVRTREDLGRILLAFVLGAVLAALSGLLVENEENGRLATPLYDPNVLASFLVAALPLSAALWTMYRSPPIRAVCLIAATIALVGIWLTGSRGGLIAFIALLVGAILLSGKARPYVAFACVVAAAATFIYFQGFASEDLRERLTEPTTGETRIHEGRVSIWQVAWRALEDKPVEGLGAGNFRVSSSRYLFEPGTLRNSEEIIEKPAVVHNAHLEVATELGLVGWLLFMAVIIGCLASLITAAVKFTRRGDFPMQTASICIALALIGTLASYVFFSDEYSRTLWLFLGLGPAMLSIARSEGEDSSA